MQHNAKFLLGIIFLGTFFHLNMGFIVRSNCGPGDTWPPNRVNSTEKLNQLRGLMRQRNIAAYYISNLNEFLSSPQAHNARREWLSGFAGSNGDLLVTLTKASLWTDSRYTIQADNEVDCNWVIEDSIRNSEWVPKMVEWLNIQDGVLGIPQKLMSVQQYEKFRTFRPKINLSPNSLPNLIDELWNSSNGRPAEIVSQINPLGISFTGKTWMSKVAAVKEAMTKESATHMIVSAQDEIPYLLNIRGDVVGYRPFFPSYIILNMNDITLYVRNSSHKLSNKDLVKHLNTDLINGRCKVQQSNNCTNIKDLGDFNSDLETLSGEITVNRIWISPSQVNAEVYNILANETLIKKITPIQGMKAIKTSTEMHAFTQCSMVDSAALVTFFANLEDSIAQNKREWTELSAAESLRNFRSQEENFKGESFETISAFGSNGAIVHYRPSKDTNKKITRDNMYLLDSGGQYLGCTTDVTRTVHFGKPTEHQRRTYTAVLKGVIDTFRSVWPNTLPAYAVGVRARFPLFEHGWTYGHGTGHGIGMFLNVHESPNRIESRTYILKIGNFQSIEPGYYESGKFGIRLETITGVKMQLQGKNNATFYSFNPVTLVPFEKALIDEKMLTNEDIKWLNSYHSRCEKETGSFLKDKGRTLAYQWLTARTKPIPLREFATISGSKQGICPALYILAMITYIIM